MTDPIRIPVQSFIDCRVEIPCVYIDADLARQIVALGGGLIGPPWPTEANTPKELHGMRCAVREQQPAKPDADSADLLTMLAEMTLERDKALAELAEAKVDLEQSRNDLVACNKDFAEAIRQRNAAQAEVERQKEINGRASDAGKCIIAERDAARADADALRAHVTALCDQLGACKHYAQMADGFSGDLPIAERVEQALTLIKDLDGYSEGMSSEIADADALAEALREAHAKIDALMAWDNNVLDEAYACREYKACVQECLELVPRLATTIAAHDARRAGNPSDQRAGGSQP